MIARSRVATVLASASVAAVGASLGRDLYKFAKKNPALLILAIASGAVAYLPYKGGRIVGGGGAYFTWKWTFTRALLGAMLSLFGMAILGLIAAIISDSLPRDAGTVSVWPVLATSILSGFLFAAGCARGFFVKRARDRADAVIGHNQVFLESNGFEDAEHIDASYLDRDGNRLRLITTQPDQLVFLAVGQRKKRAFIRLDSTGRMISYSGIVAV